MPEKLNVSLSEEEAKFFSEEFANNPHALMDDVINKPTPMKSKVAIWCLTAALIVSGFWGSFELKRAEKWKAIKREKSAAFAKQLDFKKREAEKWRCAYWAVKNELEVLVGNKETDNPLLEIEEKTRMSKVELLSWVNPKNGANIAHHHMSNVNTTPADWERLIEAGVDLNQQRLAWVGGKMSSLKTGPTVIMTGIARENWNSVLYLLTHHRDKLDLGITNNSGKTAHDYIQLKIENGAKVPQTIKELIL